MRKAAMRRLAMAPSVARLDGFTAAVQPTLAPETPLDLEEGVVRASTEGRGLPGGI